MGGAALTVKHNGEQWREGIEKVADRSGSAEPAMEIIGAHLVDSVIQNFEEGGRPAGWQELSPVTLAAKKGGTILRVQGMAGGLMGSINFQADPDKVVVGTNKVYGAIHQLGGMAGKNRKVKIPAREFLVIQDEDVEEIDEQLAEFILIGE